MFSSARSLWLLASFILALPKTNQKASATFLVDPSTGLPAKWNRGMLCILEFHFTLSAPDGYPNYETNARPFFQRLRPYRVNGVPTQCQWALRTNSVWVAKQRVYLFSEQGCQWVAKAVQSWLLGTFWSSKKYKENKRCFVALSMTKHWRAFLLFFCHSDVRKDLSCISRQRNAKRK